jgi:hypothetical protein
VARHPDGYLFYVWLLLPLHGPIPTLHPCQEAQSTVRLGRLSGAHDGTLGRDVLIAGTYAFGTAVHTNRHVVASG